jgi:hypothetical protein
VLLSAVSSVRNLLTEKFFNSLIPLVTLWLILFRFVLSCGARV